MTPIRVHVTPLIANDYLTRDVYPDAWKPGWVSVDRQTFLDMIDDADYQARWTDAGPGVKRAYAKHHTKLTAPRFER